MTDELTRRALLERGLRATALLGVFGHTPDVLLSGTLAQSVANSTRVRRAGDTWTLENEVIRGVWSTSGNALHLREIVNRRDGTRLRFPDHAFTLTLGDGTHIDSPQMRVTGIPVTETIAGVPGASRAAERLGGRRVTVVLEDAQRRVQATWRAELRDGSHYLRQTLMLRALNGPFPVREISLVDFTASAAQLTGSVRGSPVTAGNWFVGFEHPLSVSTVANGAVHITLPRELPLRPEAPFAVSSVVGIARPGQMRRDFLAYVERERAHPYRTFLHYNSWYDIAYGGKFSEPEALAVIETFGTELVTRRGVTLDSFLFDDGWDDPRTLWGFHDGFPNGLTRVREAAARFNAAPGIWMSPWGGYDVAKQQRLQYGKEQGFETNEGGFALSGPKYYQRFHDTVFHMVRDYGVNQFKFDGTGNVAHAFPGSVFDSDFDAAIHLIEDLRAEKPDIFINLTSGTFPSPFWLRYADSIWRGGEDHSFAGVGSNRQQWITYRDGATYQNTVKRGSLYPINSLMLHGMIYARHADRLDTDPHRDFPSEVRSYFGTGTHLQEMYMTPTLTQEYWDLLAEGAKWSRRNAGTLVDTHWIGGDPTALEVYGWAAWSPAKGIITLRNPKDVPQRYELKVDEALEYPLREFGPVGLRDSFAPNSPPRPPVRAGSGEYVIDLAPFEVVTLEAQPA